MIYLGLVMGTFIVPFVSAVKGFVQMHDWAWFMHPWVCFRVAAIYTGETMKNIFKRRENL